MTFGGGPPTCPSLCLTVRLRGLFVCSQNEPLFLRTYTDADGEEEEDANLRLHNIVHSSLDVVGERKGTKSPTAAPCGCTSYFLLHHSHRCEHQQCSPPSKKGNVVASSNTDHREQDQCSGHRSKIVTDGSCSPKRSDIGVSPQQHKHAQVEVTQSRFYRRPSTPSLLCWMSCTGAAVSCTRFAHGVFNIRGLFTRPSVPQS